MESDGKKRGLPIFPRFFNNLHDRVITGKKKVLKIYSLLFRSYLDDHLRIIFYSKLYEMENRGPIFKKKDSKFISAKNDKEKDLKQKRIIKKHIKPEEISSRYKN